MAAVLTSAGLHFVFSVVVEIERAPQRPLNGYKQGWLVYTHSLLSVFYTAEQAAVFLKGFNWFPTVEAFVCAVVFVFGTSPSFCRHSVKVGVLLQLFTHQQILRELLQLLFELVRLASGVLLELSSLLRVLRVLQIQLQGLRGEDHIDGEALLGNQFLLPL